MRKLLFLTLLSVGCTTTPKSPPLALEAKLKLLDKAHEIEGSWESESKKYKLKLTASPWSRYEVIKTDKIFDESMSTISGVFSIKDDMNDKKWIHIPVTGQQWFDGYAELKGSEMTFGKLKNEVVLTFRGSPAELKVVRISGSGTDVGVASTKLRMLSEGSFHQ